MKKTADKQKLSVSRRFLLRSVRIRGRIISVYYLLREERKNMNIQLIEATPEYAEQLWQFRKEVFEHDPDDGNRFAGCMSIESANSAEEWIKMCQMRKSAATCKQTGADVPSTTYFAVRKSDNKLVGVIDLRHHINHPILGTWGGHCGYTVRPSERGNGYDKVRDKLRN